MIQHLRNDQIDRNAWDECLKHASLPLVYAQSWYLDIVSPDWQALVSGHYQAIMPLTQRHKAGVHYLFRPAFVQQLGVFGECVDEQTVKDFIHAIPQTFRFAEYAFNEHNVISGTQVTPYTNIILYPDQKTENLRGRFNGNTMRNIRKAEKAGLSVYRGFDPECIINLFKNNKGRQTGQREHWYQTLRTLVFKLKHQGIAETWTVQNQHNETIAGIVSTEFAGRLTLLFSGASVEARQLGAMHFLIDQMLMYCSVKQLTFDFEGSNDENLAKFYMGFGGDITTYPFFRVNRLPWLVRWIKR